MEDDVTQPILMKLDRDLYISIHVDDLLIVGTEGKFLSVRIGNAALWGRDLMRLTQSRRSVAVGLFPDQTKKEGQW